MNPQDSVPTPMPPASAPAPTSAFLNKIDSPGRLFAFGWKLLTGHWKTLVPILILPSIGSYIGNLLAQTHQTVFVIIGTLISIASAVFSVAMLPAVINAIHRITTEPSAVISLKGQYRFGFKYFWPLILVGIIFCFAQIGSVILLVIPGIIVWVYSCLYLLTLVVDDKRGFSALTESYSLVRGRWWPVLGRVLFLALVMWIIWSIFIGVGFLVGAVSGLHLSSFIQSSGQTVPFSITVFTISAILSLVASSILAPIGMGYIYRMYMSLKSVRVAGVQTKTFKNWLTAFVCVGVIGAVLMFISLPLLILSSLNSARSKTMDDSAEVQARMSQIQAEILRQMASSTLPAQR